MTTVAQPVTILRANESAASWTQWLDCAESTQPELHKFADHKRMDWRSPPLAQLCCFPSHLRCFRGVFDNRIDVGSDAQLLPKHKRYGSPVDVSFSEQVKQILRSEFNVTRTLTRSVSRFQEFTPEFYAGWRFSDWTELHADYYERADYVFTAILYLGEEAQDETPLRGGWTGLADGLQSTVDGRVELTQGTLIEPKRGRLVLFTGGGENYHAPLAVTQGRRTAWHGWFKCACRDAPS